MSTIVPGDPDYLQHINTRIDDVLKKQDLMNSLDGDLSIFDDDEKKRLQSTGISGMLTNLMIHTLFSVWQHFLTVSERARFVYVPIYVWNSTGKLHTIMGIFATSFSFGHDAPVCDIRNIRMFCPLLELDPNHFTGTAVVFDYVGDSLLLHILSQDTLGGRETLNILAKRMHDILGFCLSQPIESLLKCVRAPERFVYRMHCW